MRCAAGLLTLFAAASVAEPAQRVLVVSYQSVGIEPAVMSRVGASLRSASAAASWSPVDAEETQRILRAATMCGEDLECLATLGQRANARWVLAWGFGKVGSSFLFTSLLVETPTSTKLATFSERLPGVPDDASPLAHRAVQTLLRDVKRPVDAPTPTPPLVVPEPAPRAQRRFLPGALTASAVAGAAAIAGGIFSGLAASQFGRLSSANAALRPALDATQRTWNLAADVLLGVAIASGVTALILFLVGAPEAP